MASGDITVKKTLTTDGPLGDVISFGKMNAEPRSLDISGKITSTNNVGNAVIRSFYYQSNREDSTFSQIRALKVGEYLNTAQLDKYYLLTNEGRAVLRVKDQNDTNLSIGGVEFSFNNKRWSIVGDDVELDYPIKIEGSLDINTSSLFIKGTLMVEGDLNASGELNINTGTPFDKAVIVDNNIEVDKLVIIGRLHGSGDFISHGEVNIMGNAEIDGDVTLYGDTKINFLDNIYKAALYEAQEDSEENNTTMTLVHSRLFSDVRGKNSVILFTFVEGDYLLNENILDELIENNLTDRFKFKSYLYGATIDYGAELQKFDSLSPYYANKLALINKFKSEGYDKIKIKESIDIAPSSLYHTFSDESGADLGTYLVYSMATSFDINSSIPLTQEDRDNALYALEHKDELEEEQSLEAQQQLEELKQNIIDNNETNITIKSEMLMEVEDEEANLTSIDPDAIKAEATEDRVHEWVEYKELASDLVEFNATEVDVPYAEQLSPIEENLSIPIDSNISVIDNNESNITTDENESNATTANKAEARGWWRRARRAVRRTFRRMTFTDCKKKREKRLIWGVNERLNDTWTRRVSLGNDHDICTAVSIGMILNYHRIKKHKSALYSSNPNSRYLPWNNFSVIKNINSGYNHSHFWDYYTKVPKTITRTMRKYGLSGYAYTRTIVSGVGVHWSFSGIKWYIKKSNPIMINTAWGLGGRMKYNNHSMPIIGYKRRYYKGVCWKRVVPEKRWLYVDTTWGRVKYPRTRYSYFYNNKSWVRFDMISNYWYSGSLTKIRVY